MCLGNIAQWRTLDNTIEHPVFALILIYMLGKPLALTQRKSTQEAKGSAVLYVETHFLTPGDLLLSRLAEERWVLVLRRAC